MPLPFMVFRASSKSFLFAGGFSGSSPAFVKTALFQYMTSGWMSSGMPYRLFW